MTFSFSCQSLTKEQKKTTSLFLIIASYTPHSHLLLTESYPLLLKLRFLLHSIFSILVWEELLMKMLSVIVFNYFFKWSTDSLKTQSIALKDLFVISSHLLQTKRGQCSQCSVQILLGFYSIYLFLYKFTVSSCSNCDDWNNDYILICSPFLSVIVAFSLLQKMLNYILGGKHDTKFWENLNFYWCDNHKAM